MLQLDKTLNYFIWRISGCVLVAYSISIWNWTCFKAYVWGNGCVGCSAAKRNELNSKNPFCSPGPTHHSFSKSSPIFLYGTILSHTTNAGALDRAHSFWVSRSGRGSALANQCTAFPVPSWFYKVSTRPVRAHDMQWGLKKIYWVESNAFSSWIWIWKLAWKLMTTILIPCRVWE